MAAVHQHNNHSPDAGRKLEEVEVVEAVAGKITTTTTTMSVYQCQHIIPISTHIMKNLL